LFVSRPDSDRFLTFISFYRKLQFALCRFWVRRAVGNAGVPRSQGVPLAVFLLCAACIGTPAHLVSTAPQIQLQKVKLIMRTETGPNVKLSPANAFKQLFRFSWQLQAEHGLWEVEALYVAKREHPNLVARSRGLSIRAQDRIFAELDIERKQMLADAPVQTVTRDERRAQWIANERQPKQREPAAWQTAQDLGLDMTEEMNKELIDMLRTFGTPTPDQLRREYREFARKRKSTNRTLASSEIQKENALERALDPLRQFWVLLRQKARVLKAKL
jgi:hypothetical protein